MMNSLKLHEIASKAYKEKILATWEKGMEEAARAGRFKVQFDKPMDNNELDELVDMLADNGYDVAISPSTVVIYW
jgi:hypothetical protein